MNRTMYCYTKKSGDPTHASLVGGRPVRPGSCHQAPVGDRRAMALLVVTLVLVMISLSAYSFVVVTQTENRASRFFADQDQAEAVADSGIELLGALLDLPRNARMQLGGLRKNDLLFRGQPVDRVAGQSRQGRVSIISFTAATDDARGSYVAGMISSPAEESATRVNFGVELQSTKLDLLTVLRWDEQDAGVGREALLRLPGMTESLADGLLDWIDKDDEPREFGAETDYYVGLNMAYQPINVVPRTLEGASSRTRSAPPSFVWQRPEPQWSCRAPRSTSRGSRGLRSSTLDAWADSPNRTVRHGPSGHG